MFRRDGYFARYLEVLKNSGGAPVTVDVRLTSNFRFISKVQNGFTFNREPSITSTSSGDTFLGVSDPANRDHWVVIDDDEDGDPFPFFDKSACHGTCFRWTERGAGHIQTHSTASISSIISGC